MGGKKQKQKTSDHFGLIQAALKDLRKELGDQTDNMHAEDVKRINYLKLDFLERLSVCMGGGGAVTYQQETL